MPSAPSPTPAPSAPAATATATAAAALIFPLISGRWTLHRTLRSALPSLPSGQFSGAATFTPREQQDARAASQEETRRGAGGEDVYAEEGELKMDNGMVMKARRKYVYRYTSDGDDEASGKGKGAITAWFVKPDSKDDEVDYFFHTLEFEEPEGKEDADGKTEIVAKGSHLCVEDNYDCEYRFCMRGDDLERFTIEYIVKGPNKDYVSTAVYTR